MSTPAWMHPGSPARHEEQRRTSERTNSIENRKQPLYYQGVFYNDQSASNSGDVTPVSLRPPMPGGFLNLPRYVPKYTVNSRLQKNLFFPDSSSVEAKNIRHENRRNRGNASSDDNSGGSLPVYADQQEKIYSNQDQTYVNHDQTSEFKTSSASHRNHGAKNNKKPGKRRSRHDGRKRSDRPGKRNDCGCNCCRCSCPKCECRCKCGCTECSPLTRRVVCVIVVVAVVAAILAAVALSLYFAYYEQLGDENPIAVNFTIQRVEFPAYLLNLNHPQTENISKALCKAFETTLQDLDGVMAKVFNCSAVEYRNGSITGIFNLDVRHQRDTFMKTPNAFLSAIREKLSTDFTDRNNGQFYSAISHSLDAGSNFEIRLNSVDWGYMSTPETAAEATVGMTTVGKTTVAMPASVNASGFSVTLRNSSASITTVSNARMTTSVSRSYGNTLLGNGITTSFVAMTTGTGTLKTTSSSSTLTSRISVQSSGKQGPASTTLASLGTTTNNKTGITAMLSS